MRSPVQGVDEVIIDIVGAIGWDVGYQQIKDMIAQIPTTTKKCVFEIYSPGGDIWDGNGCMQEIGELSKRCETVAKIQMAASMATLIACACNKRVMARNGRFLIHNAWTQTTGDAAAHEKAAQELKDCEMEAAKFYAERTGGKSEDMLALMAEERWMMPEEALKLGFVNEIDDPFCPEDYADVKRELMSANRWPKALVELPQEPVTPVVEPVVEPAKEVADAVKADEGSAPVAAVVAPEAAKPADDIEALLKAEFDRGFMLGVGQGRKEIETEKAVMFADLSKMEQRAIVAEKESSKHQSDKDKLVSQMLIVQKISDEKAASLRAELDEAAKKLRLFVSGAMVFEPAVETWEQAMQSCGDYATAAKKYPELLKQFRATKIR